MPTSTEARPDERAHTIFDRTLLRAGETVSMKHLLRAETRQGFALPTARPDTLVITHVGSGQQFTQPLAWRNTATGGLSAQSSFAVPPAAKLGVYQVELRNDASTGRGFGSGEFRVEEFRLPVLQGRITPSDKKALVHVRSVPTDVQISYVAGGYRLGAGTALPPLLLEDEEAIAVALGLGNPAGTSDDIENASLRALAKLEQLMHT